MESMSLCERPAPNRSLPYHFILGSSIQPNHESITTNFLSSKKIFLRCRPVENAKAVRREHLTN